MDYPRGSYLYFFLGSLLLPFGSALRNGKSEWETSQGYQFHFSTAEHGGMNTYHDDNSRFRRAINNSWITKAASFVDAGIVSAVSNSFPIERRDLSLDVVTWWHLRYCFRCIIVTTLFQYDTMDQNDQMYLNIPGNGNPLVFAFTRMQNYSANFTSRLFVSTDYGRTYDNVSATSKLKLADGRVAKIHSCIKSPSSTNHVCLSVLFLIRAIFCHDMFVFV